MWVELIQQAEESMKFPNSFEESQLCLIPKIENIPYPDQFRPISVTNFDYWIVMWYWAFWFSEIASGVISDTQHAMFKEKSIDAAVETIYDVFYEALADRQDITLLQTDFCKTYDYINYNVLIHILKRLKAPPQAIFVIEKVFHPSKTWLPSIGGKLGSFPADSITSRTEVQQGCPISPLLFLIVFDLLLVSLNKNHPLEKLSGFMNDLGLLLKKVDTINLLTTTFQKYEKTTSALLNYSKCFVLTTQMYKPSGSWSAMLKTNFRSNETTYLGV